MQNTLVCHRFFVKRFEMSVSVFWLYETVNLFSNSCRMFEIDNLNAEYPIKFADHNRNNTTKIARFFLFFLHKQIYPYLKKKLNIQQIIIYLQYRKKGSEYRFVFFLLFSYSAKYLCQVDIDQIASLCRNTVEATIVACFIPAHKNKPDQTNLLCVILEVLIDWERHKRNIENNQKEQNTSSIQTLSFT